MTPAVASLKKSADFQRLSRTGRKWISPSFIMLTAESSSFRCGLTVSRKVGNAVVRNRVKRRLRAALRQALAGGACPSLDIVLIARATDKEIEFAVLVDDIRRGLAKLAGAA